MPVTDRRRALPSSAQAWKRSLIVRSSRSRPTNGASRPCDFSDPRRPDTMRSARHNGVSPSLPFSSKEPASSKTTVSSVARRVASPTYTVPGGALDWTRDAVLTRSPATMPCPSAPIVTAASPVSTPARARSSWAPTSSPSAVTAETRSSAARTARSASSSVAVGVPHTAMTASPMNFSTVPPYTPMIRRQMSK